MYTKTNKMYPFIFNSFLKRFLVLSLAIILSFTTVCKPKQTDASVLMTISVVAGILLATTGVVLNTTEIVDWFSDKKGMSENDVCDYFGENVTVDGDGNYIFSDDAKLTINQLLTDYNESITMVYRYPVNPNYVDASSFKTKQGYDEFLRVFKENPDKFFYYTGSYDEFYGRTHYFLVFDTLESAISLYPDLLSSRCQFYDENWNTPLNAYSIGLIDETRDDDKMWCYTNTGNGMNLNVSFDDIFSASDIGRKTVADGVLYSINDFSCGLDKNTIYSAYAGAINTYKSVDDMKKDIGSQVIGNYNPDYYTGTPNYNITTSEVNNIVNNYYPDSGGGSGSGSDDTGSGSGGGIFDDIISGISSGVGSIIKGIFSIIKELVDAISDAIGSIVGSITDLMSLLNGNFTDFLSAVFPFLPSEFITILIASITLCMLGVIIKIFKG